MGNNVALCRSLLFVSKCDAATCTQFSGLSACLAIALISHVLDEK